MRFPYRTFIFILLIALAAAIVMAVSLGAVRISPSEILRILSGWTGDSGNAAIIWGLRLPRIVLALLVGASLGAAGMVLQAIFRNPLADPYIVGISSGASLGAALILVLGLSGPILGLDPLPLAAFIGALGAAWTVYMLSCKDGRVSIYTLLLAGVAVSALISALTSFIMIMGRRDLQAIFFWIMGGFYSANWKQVLLIAPYAVAGIILIWSYCRDLNVMLMGDEEAQHLGLDVEKTKRILLAITSLLTAAAVSVSGIIGFVGLIVPHAARLLIGPDHRRLLWGSLLLGALVMIISDVLARTLLAPSEIPVGLITAMLGAPFFIYLLYRRGR